MSAEIRNSIYNYALGGYVFDVSKPYPPLNFQGGLSKHSLALTRTCRQIYAETSLVAFATNTFYIDTWYAGGVGALAFLAERNTAELESIQSCFLCVGSLKVARRILEMMPNIHKLQMTVSHFCTTSRSSTFNIPEYAISKSLLSG